MSEIAQALSTMIKAGLTGKEFSTGSKGFWVSDKIMTVSGERYQAQAQVVLIGSKENPKVKVQASAEDVAAMLVSMIPIDPPMPERTFSSGKQGYRKSDKIEIGDQRFQASIQAVRLPA